MAKWYPNQNDLKTPQMLERTFKTLLDGLYYVSARSNTEAKNAATSVKSIATAVTPQAMAASLQAGGKQPLNVEGLLGLLAQPQRASIPTVTDLPSPNDSLSQDTGLVRYQGKIWVFDATTEPGTWVQLGATAYFDYGTYALRPAVTAADNGKVYWATDRNIIYMVEGGAWVYAAGIMQDTYANRPAVAAADNGMPFWATNYNLLFMVEAGAWVWVAGCMHDTLANQPVLVAADVGARYFATDATEIQEYYWTGAAWATIVPDASATVRGAVTTGAQTIAGNKTLTGVTELGDGAAHYTNFDTTGHQTMVGNAQPWDDLRIEPTIKATGSNDPAFEQWFTNGAGSRGVYLYSFTDVAVANEKEVFYTMQMPHSWNQGDVHVHVHWIGNVDDVAAAPRWGLEYNWKEPGQVFGNTLIVYSDGVNYTEAGSDADITAFKHYRSKFAAISPGATANGLSSIMICRVFRNSSDAADTYDIATNKCGLLYVDAHFQLNSIGSTDEYTK